MLKINLKMYLYLYCICLLLSPNNTFATTYNIGPGQTYETFVNLVAAITLQPGDVVDGGGNTFTEKWSPNNSGSSLGGDITLQNATIDGSGETQAFFANTRDYITLDNIHFIGGSSESVRFQGGTDNITITNCEFTNNIEETLKIDYGTNITVDSNTFNQSAKESIYFNTNGVSYVTDSYITNNTLNSVEGVTTSTFSIQVNSSDNTEITGNTINNCAGISVSGGDSLIISNNSIDHTGNGIVLTGTTNFTLSNNNVSRSVAGGYGVITQSNASGSSSNNSVNGSYLRGFSINNTSNITSNNDSVTSCGYDGVEGHGFYILGSSVVVLNYPLASNCTGDGFSANETSTVTINKGFAKNNGNVSGVGSGDGYTAHDTATLNVNSSFGLLNYKSGIMVVGGSSGEVKNSTFYNNYETSQGGNFGISIGSTGTWVVKNNITSGHELEIHVPAGSISGGLTFSSDYNLFDNNRGGDTYSYEDSTSSNILGWKTDSGQDINSLEFSPLFSSSTPTLASGFTLTQFSPAIDSGTNVGLTTDYSGNSIYGTPDIGAYEYQPPYTI